MSKQLGKNRVKTKSVKGKAAPKSKPRAKGTRVARRRVKPAKAVSQLEKQLRRLEATGELVRGAPRKGPVEFKPITAEPVVGGLQRFLDDRR